jgi:ABC-type antimicrobial peptide transport system permease subunit
MWQGTRLTAIGLAIGLALAYGLVRVLSSLLFGVKSSDPVSFAATAGVLAAVALAATYIPARRASKIAPSEALRSQ